MITILFHSKANPLTFHSGPYGDIACAKSWCGFDSPRRITALYRKWREGVKAYITQRSWDPTNLTDAQFDSVLDFARSLPPLSAQLKDIKANHRKSEVRELERHVKIFVKDVAKKLQTTFERRNADPESAGICEDGRSKHFVSSTFVPSIPPPPPLLLPSGTDQPPSTTHPRYPLFLVFSATTDWEDRHFLSWSLPTCVTCCEQSPQRGPERGGGCGRRVGGAIGRGNNPRRRDENVSFETQLALMSSNSMIKTQQLITHIARTEVPPPI